MTVSVVTVSYNAAATIADCLRSVAIQTFPSEHFIIDGASTDNTLAIISAITPHACIISEPDNGIYDAMNKGIAQTTGEIIGILNADDFYASPNVLALVTRAFEDPEVMCCYGDLEYVQETGKTLGGSGEKENQSFKVVRYWQSEQHSSRSFYWGWMPPHPTFFVRRCVYERFGMFRLDMGSAADYELMLRFLLKNNLKTAYIPDVLVRMRVGGASNGSLQARLKANAMDRQAWKVNGLKPYPWSLLCKPLRKLSQYFLIAR